MSRQRIPTYSILLVIAAVAVATGCRPQLSPDPDAVLYYFRNARVQGEVKRVWPEGQDYVNAVLKGDGKLQAELNKLTTWRATESLWPSEDPRWNDTKQLAEQVDKLTKLINDGGAKREEALANLEKAIAALPASLKLSPTEAQDFIGKVWQALALDGPGLGLDVRQAPAQYTAVAQAHLDLCRAVQESAGDFDPSAAGLKFKDATRRESIDKTYAELAAQLQARREQFLQFADQALIASRQPTTNPREERYQVFRRAYLRKQLEAVPKSIAALIERTEGQLKQAEKATTRAAPAEVAFLKQRIKDLSALREELKARTEVILKKAQTAK